MQKLNFHIVITGRNVEPWVCLNINSGLAQYYYYKFRYYVHYVDNASTDGTAAAGLASMRDDLRAVLTGCGGPRDYSIWTLYRNVVEQPGLQYQDAIIRALDPADIVVILDADDWFPHGNVLARLAQAYADPDTWMTYGSFKFSDGRPGWATEYPSGVVEARAYRDDTWRATHLRTFRAGLWQRILPSDLRPGGEAPHLDRGWLRSAWDLATMFPMLEMSGAHARFISDVLYVYNDRNPAAAALVRPELERSESIRIRSMPRYNLLMERPW